MRRCLDVRRRRLGGVLRENDVLPPEEIELLSIASDASKSNLPANETARRVV